MSHRVALITGARSGIGHAVARQFLKEGWLVAVTGRNNITLRAAYFDVPDSSILYIAADSTNLDHCSTALNAVLSRFGRLDCLVNNVGGGTLKQTLLTTTPAEFNNSHLLNLSSVFFMTQAAIPALTETKGSIVNMSSVLATRPVPGLAPYCVHKAAVEMLTRSSAMELAPLQIRVNCVAPSVTQTDFHTNAGMSQTGAADYYSASATAHPLGRIGQSPDIATVTTFLADGDKSGFVTGTIIPVDGGRLMTMSTASGMASPPKN
jgi:NAD(P)-dependent dehydrogenase (short-subunit alcohol dehydrogenase family)